ncbi:hypothetical protein [Thermospira aquatica]|uniref:Two component regulator three Y domain-containing protein n=1 Tax=Thermospira aquatica TaxID=2828656 RepID=A0AAX3BF82_9SPIR|nr:hypothetical protein [Thermospira aquatica]URA10881.1 hypothetical protein KDW03_03500 [Thermospira aquatica]
MKRFCGMVFFVIAQVFFGTETLFFPLFDWNRIGEYELSNVILSSTGEATVSFAMNFLYESDLPLWSATGWKNFLLVGTAEEASLLWIDGKSIRKQDFPEYQMVSALASDDSYVYVGVAPSASLLLFNGFEKSVASYTLSSSYIWDIIPFSRGVWVLAGDPAVLYLLEKNKLQRVASLSHERHLLKGVWTEDGLYCIGESSILYLLPVGGTRFRAVAEFSDPIQDITFDGKNLYVAINKTTSQQSSQRKMTERSEVVVFRYEKNGSLSFVFSLSQSRVNRLFFWQGKLYLGAFQNFFIYDPVSGQLSASGYGKGGVRFFATARDRLHMVSEKPYRVFQMDVRAASEGSILTPVFDAGQKAQWGKILSLESLGQVTLSSRSALALLPDLWEEWAPYQKEGIASPPNRYLQVRLSCSPTSRASLKEVKLSGRQMNQAPKIDQFDVMQRGEKLVFFWSASDPNEDDMNYTLSVRRREKWVPLFSSPLTNNQLELSSRMFPEGEYEFQFLVDDAPSNPHRDVLSAFQRSGFVTIDHTSPQIKNFNATLVQGKLQCEWLVSDNREIVQVWYSVSPLDWQEIFPADGMYDSREERFTLIISNFSGGYVQIRARDRSGNESVYGQWLIP